MHTIRHTDIRKMMIAVVIQTWVESLNLPRRHETSLRSLIMLAIISSG